MRAKVHKPLCTRYRVGSANVPLRCPFCGQPEEERVSLEGKTLVIFPCMFSPLVDPAIPSGELQGHLNERYGKEPEYFRKQCDRLHARLAVRGIDG